MTFIHVSLDLNSDSPMFSPHHQTQVTISIVGVLLWLTGISTWIYYKGFWEVFRLYLVPYLWLVRLVVKLFSLLTLGVQGKPLASAHHVLATH